MKATVGDEIVITSQYLGEHVRGGEIIEVHGAEGEPPYAVKWCDEEYTGLIFPNADARIEHRLPVFPRGSRRLARGLDVILVRKLGVPFQPELGMGAIGEDGVRVVNYEVMRKPT